MFLSRLKTLMGVLAVVLAVITARLIDLQVVQADYFRDHAADILILPPKSVPSVRGPILDRFGRVLASDEPSWDVSFDYGLLSMDEEYVQRAVRACQRSGRYGPNLGAAEVRRAFLAEVEQLWNSLARLHGGSVDEIHERIAQIRDRVERIRAVVKRRRGFETVVREEHMRHAVVTGLNDQEQVRARVLVQDFPWGGVQDATQRVYHDALPLAHVLGRTAAVDADDIRDDPRADDPLGRYLPDEICGIAGAEAGAEQLLRGYRGRIVSNLKGEVLEDVPAAHGQEVYLTLRYDLQAYLYELFGDCVSEIPEATGGVVIVLDIPSREVLAMVSYPSYDPNRFAEEYELLRDDTKYMPLRFRAVANQYEPGSIVKPLACAAALGGRRISLDTRFVCTGSLFPEQPDRWRCWEIHGTNVRKAHGAVNVVEAIEGSCNVFMYHVGEVVGVDGLTNFFDLFGIGRFTGIGLAEEARGINPTPSWLSGRGRSVTPGLARNYAIGQGEMNVTPIQAANMMAVYASGINKPVTLIRGLRDETPEWELPLDDAHWRAIREGLFRVVNSPEGTAYRFARFEGPGYAICGKTGSATTTPWPLSYRVSFVDADGRAGSVVVPAGSRAQAAEDFERMHPGSTVNWNETVVHDQWPRGDDDYSHAWFAAFLQAVDADGSPRWNVPPRIAFAVLTEFGGSGGRTSGPIAKKVAGAILNVLGPDLDPDAPPSALPVVEPMDAAAEATE